MIKQRICVLSVLISNSWKVVYATVDTIPGTQDILFNQSREAVSSIQPITRMLDKLVLLLQTDITEEIFYHSSNFLNMKVILD